MPGLPAFLLRHTVFVTPYLDSGPFGDRYGLEEPLRCFLDERRRLVRAATGEEVVSEATVYASPGAVVPAGSRVRLPDGRVATVIVVHRRDGGGLPVPDHVEIVLT